MSVSAIYHLITTETNHSTISAMVDSVLGTTSAPVPQGGEAGVARSQCVNQGAGTMAGVWLPTIANVCHHGQDQLAKKVTF